MGKRYKIHDRKDRLPAGWYYIGDPCYVIEDGEWSEALDDTRYFNMFRDGTERDYNDCDLQYGVFSRNGILFAVSSTAYGDGCYPCTKDGVDIGSCGVDAGLIGAIPRAMLDVDRVNRRYSQGLEGLGCVVRMERPFQIEYENGTIIFGGVEVETGDED